MILLELMGALIGSILARAIADMAERHIERAARKRLDGRDTL